MPHGLRGDCDTPLADLLDRWDEPDLRSWGVVSLPKPDLEEKVSYRQLLQRVRRSAAWFEAAGLEPGSRVLLAGEHDLAMILAFLGALYAGMVPAVLPYLSQYRRTDVYGPTLAARVEKYSIRAVVAAPGAELEAACPVLEFDPARLPERQAQGRRVAATEPAFLQFTSGTSGASKCVLISAHALLSQVDCVARTFPFGLDDVAVGWMPWYHDAGLVVNLLMPLLVGGRLVTLPPTRWVRNPSLLFRAVSEFSGSMIFMPNWGYHHATTRSRARDLAGLDLSSLRIVANGGEPIQAETMRNFWQKFAAFGARPETFRAGYGLAEATCAVTISDGGMLVNDHDVVSCGPALPGNQVAIWGEHGMVSDGQPGEILVRSHSLMAGYLEDGPAVIEDGWLHTGDRGYCENGQLYVVGRQDDMLICGGRNFPPAPLEDTALQAGGNRLRRVAVVGIRAGGESTESAVLIGELRRSSLSPPQQELLAADLRHAIWHHHGLVLADVRLVEAGFLEVTTSGKLRRQACRAAYLLRGWGPTQPTLPRQRTPQSLVRYVLRVLESKTGQSLDADANLLTVGLDSLALVDLIWSLEAQLAVEISVEALAEEPTVNGLVALVMGQSPPMQPPSAPPPGRPHKPAKNWLSLVRERGPQWGRLVLPYAAGSWLLTRLLSQPWLATRLWRSELGLLRQLLEVSQVEQPWSPLLTRFMLANTWSRWRRHAISSEWTTACGWSEPEGGTVLAIVHSRLNPLLLGPEAFPGRPLAAVGRLGTMARRQLGYPAQHPTAESLIQLDLARRALSRAGVAVVAVDWDDGEDGVVVAFRGRRRVFRSGAARLAVETGARLLAFYPQITPTGQVRGEFVEVAQPAYGTVDERVEFLTRSLALNLELRWPDVVASLRPRALEHHLRILGTLGAYPLPDQPVRSPLVLRA